MDSRAKPGEAGSRWGWVVPLVGLVVGLVLTFGRTFRSGFQRVQGSFLDSRLNNLFLEHSWSWVRNPGGHPLWDAPFFHPAPDTFAYSDVLLSAAPLYWAVRGLGLPPDTAFQLWLVLCLALAFAGMAVLLRRGFRLPWIAATGGAFLFAFGAPRIAQMGRPQLLVHFWSLLTIFALVRLLAPAPDAATSVPGEREPGEGGPGRRALPWVALFFLGVVAQFYAAFYLGWFLVFGLLVGLAVALALPSTRPEVGRRLARLWPAAVVGGGLAAAALLPLALRYLSVADDVGGRSYWAAVPGLARPWSWIHLGESSHLWGWLMDLPVFTSLPQRHEQVAGIGFVTLAAVVVGMVTTRRHLWSRVAAASTVALVLLATVWHPSASPWRLVHALVPGAEAIRTPARAVLLLLIPASVWLAYALRAAGRYGPWAALALGLVVVGEQSRSTASYEKGTFRARQAAVAARVEPTCASFYHSFRARSPSPAEPWWGDHAERQIDAMWVALELGIPTLNGYSGNRPPGWELRENVVWRDGDPAALQASVDRWARRHGLEGVCHVVVEEAGTTRSDPVP